MIVALHKLAHWCHGHGLKPLGRLLQWIIFFGFSAVIPCEVKLGDGTKLAHGGVGTVIHPQAKIGRNVMIHHGVTIGGKSTRSAGVPVIGNNVYIGAGAKILGAIEIGDDSLIGANAVVVKSVPPGSLVVGVPGVVRKSGIRARDLESW